ncbi:hypothetical protein N7462_001635 [Penicillium macrosclerotiorum]|uniref:uncharacterized protein n=1 Tax=Penicillium macrosclerotiorum TaxID=303699 RepID=UPI0025488AB0|nr:uncharacterized protein N7462_001635 [Penicillium macrosclerotiorum]KAJ5692212.1 hypothetical protein N7462_001635 [Penicillium macrosclerotiorum]
MDKVDSLVERARCLALHQIQPVDKFHETLDGHLQKIYDSICISDQSRSEFLRTVEKEPGPAAQPTADPLVTVDDFRAYMKNSTSCAQAAVKDLDLSAPISDYFVSSSHNTYLTGNQLYSEAAASAYTSVLLRGCRSVEIDVWDGESDDSDSSDSDTSDDSDDNEKTPSPSIKQRIMSKIETQEKSASRVPQAVSTRLGDALRRKTATASVTAPSEEAFPNQKAIKGEPRVLHGHTLTKGTSFREIAYAIRDSAFVASNLPVIISFEVHACLEQQQIMVDIMREAWKGLLVELSPNVEADKLPSLAELRRKILIKTKSIPLTPTEEKEEPLVPLESEELSGQSGVVQPPVKPVKVLEALAKMAIYTQAYRFSHFEQPGASLWFSNDAPFILIPRPEAKIPVHIFSLSEKACREAHDNHREALFEHNRSSLMRIYPYAFRVNSSNLDPSFCWRRGAQLVALNWQNVDKGMMLNHGMFFGTPGWEMKPSGYRSSEPSPVIICRRTLDLKVEVFAAQDLALPPGNRKERNFRPYVNCQLHVEEPEGPVVTGREDASSDSEKSSYRRCTKSSSGRNPDFEGQTLAFPTIKGIIEDLSFVRFKIKDDEIGRDSLAAWACIRLDRLREGFRLVHLHDRTGEKTGGILLVHIKKQVTE